MAVLNLKEMCGKLLADLERDRDQLLRDYNNQPDKQTATLIAGQIVALGGVSLRLREMLDT